MDKPLTLFAEVDDPNLAAEFRATLEREDRSMKAVLIRAVRDYIERSKAAESQSKPTNGKKAVQSA